MQFIYHRTKCLFIGMHIDLNTCVSVRAFGASMLTATGLIKQSDSACASPLHKSHCETRSHFLFPSTANTQEERIREERQEGEERQREGGWLLTFIEMPLC